MYNGLGDRGSISGQVIPKTRMVVDVSLLNTQHHKAHIKGKWNNPGKGVAPSPTPKTQMVVDVSLLNTQHYKAHIKGKWNNPGKGVAPSPTPRHSSY